MLNISPVRVIRPFFTFWVLFAAWCGRAEEVRPVVTYAQGRVLIRKTGSTKTDFPKEGRPISGGELLITGDKACMELRAGESGLWRVGRRALLSPEADGGRLMAGTALVRVPDPAGWRVVSTRGAARLGKGLWMLQATDNDGLKIVCLDGPAPVEALGETHDGAVLDRLVLKPGELVFLRPDGREFGPIVTIFLQELLLTSRLVSGFPRPLEESRRLANLGIAQRERLKGVSNALVAGAREESGFDIAVPKPKAAPKK